MSLRSDELQVLSALEGELGSECPRLAGRFAVFARLYADEPLPPTERVHTPRRLTSCPAPPGDAGTSRRLRRLMRATPWPAVVIAVIVALALTICLLPSHGAAGSTGRRQHAPTRSSHHANRHGPANLPTDVDRQP